MCLSFFFFPAHDDRGVRGARVSAGVPSVPLHQQGRGHALRLQHWLHHMVSTGEWPGINRSVAQQLHTVLRVQCRCTLTVRSAYSKSRKLSNCSA